MNYKFSPKMKLYVNIPTSKMQIPSFEGILSIIPIEYFIKFISYTD